MWEGVGDRTEQQHIDPHSIGHNRVPFPFSWAAQPGTWGFTLLGAGFLYRILSPTGLVSKLTDFLSSLSYIIVQHPLLLVGITNALIQPIHGQGYNSDIPRPDAPVIYIGAFPILTARPGRRSIYNNKTRWDTQWQSNSLTMIYDSSLLTITPHEMPMQYMIKTHLCG